MRTISGLANAMGIARPRGCVRLKVALSLLALCRLWSRRSLLRNSTVPPTGTRTTRGTNEHAFWSISTLTGAFSQFGARRRCLQPHDGVPDAPLRADEEVLGLFFLPADILIDGDRQFLLFQRSGEHHDAADDPGTGGNGGNDDRDGGAQNEDVPHHA